MMQRFACWGLIAVTGVLSGCASYQKYGLSGCRTDKKITVAVEAVIHQYPSLEAPNQIRVQTVDHVVYLYGQVSTDLQSEMAQQAALSVDGVTRVVNSISLGFEGR